MIPKSKSSTQFRELPVRESNFDHARIPKLYWDAKATEQPIQGFIKAMPRNILQDGAGLLLLGPHGSGKTHNAVAILIAALKWTKKVLYIPSPEVIRAFSPEKPMFDDGVRLERVLFDRDVLVIDDAGSEYRGSQSGFSETSLINLIRNRTQNKRSTIITTNLDGNRIEELYTPSMRSLLNELLVPVVIKREDFRRSSPKLSQNKKRSGISS